MKVVGIILIVLQILSLLGGMPNVPGGGYGFGFLLGYFLPGIIGVILLVKGSKKKAKDEEQE